MTNRTEWYKTDIKGQLFIETVLVEGNEPVLFTCVDESEQRYLVEMLDSFEGKYLIISINTDDLLYMLKDKITLEETFRKQKEAYLTSFNDDFDLVLEAVKNSEISSEYLPSHGAYFELSTPKIRKYLEQLSNEDFIESCHVTVHYYDNKEINFSSSVTISDILQFSSNEYFEPQNYPSKINFFELDSTGSMERLSCEAA